MRLDFIIAIVIVLAAPGVTSAQTASAAEDLPTRLRSGDTVYVLDSVSREITGVFGKLSDSHITLMVNGELRDIDFAEVRQITRRGRDPLWNGALIGAVVGATLGGLQGLGTALGGAVLYGVIGAELDRAVDGRVVVYRAPARKSVVVSPFAAEGRRGVRVAISF